MRDGGDSPAILDSSVLIAMGGPSTDKYQSFEQHVTRQNISVRIHDHVAEELGESPEADTYQRDRLRAAQNAGWLERAELEPAAEHFAAIAEDENTSQTTEQLRQANEQHATAVSNFRDTLQAEDSEA